MSKLSLLDISAALLFCLGALWAQSAVIRTDRGTYVQAQQSGMWTGTLVDTDCEASASNTKCEVAETTKAFGLYTSEYFKLDADNNAKVRAALEVNDRKTGEIKASLSGTTDGDTLKVESVELL